MNEIVDWSTEGHQPAEFSLPVDQVEGRRMIHCVSECLIPGNHLLGDDTVGFLNGLELVGGPVAPRKLGLKAARCSRRRSGLSRSGSTVT